MLEENKHMNEAERKLLENIFDALDRLFDKKCNAIDVYALIFASEKALGESFTAIELGGYIIELNKIVRSVESDEFQREEALKVTNSLRDTLNKLLSL